LLASDVFRGDAIVPQAGWYAAPEEQGMLRWWNGAHWTDHRQLMPSREPDASDVVTPAIRSIGGPLRGMLAAALVAAVGLIFIAFMSQQNPVAAGEVQVSGVVTSLGWQQAPGASSPGQRDCYPIATYALGGVNYSAHSSVGNSVCPVRVGQKVPVVYSAADPGQSGRLDLANSAPTSLWAIPALGVLGFIASLWIFIRRQVARSRKRP
jgi:hypothetical protein